MTVLTAYLIGLALGSGLGFCLAYKYLTFKMVPWLDAKRLELVAQEKQLDADRAQFRKESRPIEELRWELDIANRALETAHRDIEAVLGNQNVLEVKRLCEQLAARLGDPGVASFIVRQPLNDQEDGA